METDCVFCKIAKGDISSDRIYENEDFFSILDRSPVTPGHSLIIPKRHFNNSLDLPSDMGQEFLDCVKNTAIIQMKKYHSEGFNLVNNNFSAAGQVVNHVHFHLIPRKNDDGLRMIA